MKKKISPISLSLDFLTKKNYINDYSNVYNNTKKKLPSVIFKIKEKIISSKNISSPHDSYNIDNFNRNNFQIKSLKKSNKNFYKSLSGVYSIKSNMPNTLTTSLTSFATPKRFNFSSQNQSEIINILTPKNKNSIKYCSFRLFSPKTKLVDDKPKLIAEIMDVKPEQKMLKISKSVKKVPIALRKDYFDYILNKKYLNYKYNANSIFVHRKNSEYMLNSLIKKRNNYRYKRNSKYYDEISIELQDKVTEAPFEVLSILKEVKKLYAGGIEFNDLLANEKFYNNYLNKINFEYDTFRVPEIKNTLVKVILKSKNQKKGFCDWKNLNGINKDTLDYLNKLKTKLQREKDEQLKEKNNNTGIEIGDTFEKEKFNKQLFVKEKKIKYNIDDIVSLNDENNEDLFFIENFLHLKLYSYNDIGIASEKLRKAIYCSK